MKQIERSQFNDLREKVSELGKTTPKKLEIEQVSEDGAFFPWNNHNVTGKELNGVTKVLQESFMEVNGYVQELYNGFKIVAQTFETLDKNYVATLLYNLEETNKASNNAFKASEEALHASRKADISIAELRDLQQQLKRTVEAISSKLAEHRQQLENFSQKHARLSEEVRENKVKHNNERLEIKRSVENLKELLDKLKGKSQTLSSDLVEIDEKVAKLEVQREKAVKQSLEFEEQIQQLSAQNQRLEAELQTMADEKDKASFFNVPNVASISALLLVVLHFILNLCGVV